MLYAGDWNVSINPELNDRSYLHVNNPKAREVIKKRKDGNGWVDGCLVNKQPTQERLDLISGWF